MVEYFFPLTCTSLEISSLYLLLFETFDAMAKHKLFAGRKIFRAENLPDLGFAFPTGPIFFMQTHELDRGFHRFFSRWKFQDPEASDNLLGFGERPIDRFDFSARKPHARPSCSRFQCSTAMKCAGFSGFFVELIHRVKEFLGRLHRGFGVLDQHHKSHVPFSFLFLLPLPIRRMRTSEIDIREIIFWRRVACRVLCGDRWLRWEQNRPVRKTAAARFRNPEFRAEPARAWPIPALLRAILPG